MHDLQLARCKTELPCLRRRPVEIRTNVRLCNCSIAFFGAVSPLSLYSAGVERSRGLPLCCFSFEYRSSLSVLATTSSFFCSYEKLLVIVLFTAFSCSYN